MWKQKKQQKVHYDRLKRFNSRKATTVKKEPKKGKIEQNNTKRPYGGHQNWMTQKEEKFELKEVLVKLILILKLTMRQSKTNRFKHLWVGVQENQ